MKTPPAHVRIPSQWPLLRVSRQSANDKSDEMIPGAVHTSPIIYLIGEENPGKPQLGDSQRRQCDHLLPSK